MRLHSGSGIELGSEMQCVYGQSEHSPSSPDWALRSPTVMMLASEMQGVVYLQHLPALRRRACARCGHVEQNARQPPWRWRGPPSQHR